MPRLVLDSSPEAPSLGLRALDSWLYGVPDEVADRVRLAAGEALGNAVEHGPGTPITMTWTPTPDGGTPRSAAGGTLCVDDASRVDAGRFADPDLPDDSTATHGRGLYILTQVSDGVRVTPGRGLCLDFVHRASD